MTDHSKNIKWIGLSILFLCATIYSIAPAQAIEIFNVKNYGAVGDGTHDDTNAIRSAIADASKAQGNIVLLPGDGLYLFSSALHLSGIKLVGSVEGPGLLAANQSAEVDVAGS